MLLLSYVKRYKKYALLALLFAAINQVFSLLDPYIFGILVDNFIADISSPSTADFLSGIGVLLLAMAGVALVSRIAKNIQEYFVASVSERVGTDMYADSVDHTFSLPFQVFEDRQSGEILQKMQKARDDAKKFIRLFVDVFFLSLVGVFFVLVYSFTLHWSITVLFFTIIPLFSFIAFKLSGRIKESQQSIVRESAELAGQTTETLRNVELVKSLGLEQQEIKRLNKVNTNILHLELKKVKQIRLLVFLQGTSISTLRLLLLFLSGYLVFLQTITPGQFFTIMFYSFFIFRPLMEFGEFIAAYQEAKASNEQLREVLALPPEKTPASPQLVDRITSVSFNGVDFTYQQEDSALVNVSCSFQAGQTIAFTGHSGSGKSTLVKLLVGLYSPNKGEVTVNGISLSAIDKSLYRSKIGFVAQETQLFSGTIRDNLLFVSPHATDEECIAVLKQASIDHLLGREGLDARIGEGGIKLSGGERQRLAIARALLRNPDILIFDEATSSLDGVTEQAITQTIRSLQRSDLIVILIAHRLSTIMHADMIHVLEAGKIVESGSHDALARKNDAYAHLLRQQKLL